MYSNSHQKGYFNSQNPVNYMIYGVFCFQTTQFNAYFLNVSCRELAFFQFSGRGSTVSWKSLLAKIREIWCEICVVDVFKYSLSL
jgi:hypothetical protein